MIVYNNVNEIVGHIQEDSLINADCLEAMKLIEDKSINCIICDLPYGITKNKFNVGLKRVQKCAKS